MQKTRVVLLSFSIFLLIGALLLGACGEKEVIKEVPVEKIVEKEVIKEVPVKPEFTGEIHIAYLPWVTGPAAEYNPITWGFLDYMHDLNDKGGIEGQRWKFIGSIPSTIPPKELLPIADLSKSTP